ncbi:MAG: DUF11 domain-containing protein [Actinomycetota bacterium]|nr:DUF11 domain-containing protein [Actinomycetota bacterium]
MLTVELPALSPSIIPQTNVDLGRSSAAADNDADLDNAKAGDQRSAAVAATTGSTSILGAAVGIAENRASAPASEANEDVVLPLDLSPLLNLPVIRTTALANWLSDTECVSSDTPMSYADQALADLTLLGGEALGGGAVADLNTADGEGAVDAEVSTFLASINGPGADQRAVQSRIKTDVTSLDVLADLAGPGALIHADVVQNPNWVVSASGLPGGASVTGPDPAVNVSIAGTPLINLSSGNAPVPAELTELNLLDLLDMDLTTDLVADLLLDVLGPAAQPLIDALTGPIVDAVETVLETLSPVAMLSIPTEIVEAADGTSASVEGALLRVELLAPSAPSTPLDPLVDDVLNAILGALGADTGEPLLAVNVAPYEGNVVAPAGGIDCGSDNPLRELNKHASALEVAPGGTFEYNIAVPNRGPCVVTDVKVTDVITGPAGFEVLTTEPPATSNQNGTLTFDLGDIAVNETKNITITVKVPANAPSGSSFDDVVQVEGNCNDKPITEDDTLLDTPTVKTDFTGECTVQNSNKDASHIQVFPGQTFSYYVHAFNSGGEPCTNVKIVDTLDARLTFVSCNKNCTHSGDQVTWTIPTLGGGSSAILSVVVQVEEDATGELANTAIISPEGKPPKTVTTTGPVIGPTSIPKDPISPSRGSLPKTGLEIPLVLTLLTGALGYGLLHLRRRADAAALS